MTETVGFSAYYELVTLHGNECIEWKFPELSGQNDKKEKAWRRRIKDYVGLEYLDMPMLDRKKSNSGLVYSDIIVTTDVIIDWENLMTTHYSNIGYRMDKKQLSTYGHQLTWFDDDTPVVSINFYPGKKKYMVQPGGRDPARLDEWLRNYANWKLNLPETTEAEQIDEEARDVEEYIDVDAEAMKVPSAPQALYVDLPPIEERVDMSDSPQEGASSEQEVEMNQTWETLPTRDPDVFAAALVAMETRLITVIRSEQHEWRKALLQNSDIERRQYEATINSLKTQLKSREEYLIKIIETYKVDFDKLFEEIQNLRSQVAKQTTDVSHMKWQQFRGQRVAREPRVLLMGTSVIRDMDEQKMSNTKVVCMPGAHITDLTDEMRKQDTTDVCDRTVIVGDGNDCETSQNVPELVAKYKDLITAAKSTARSVTVASICPRGPEKTQECIDSVNAGIQGLCGDLGCAYADTTDILKLRDGSLNEGYFVHDLVHLTHKGQNKVAKMLDIKPSDESGTYNVVSTNQSRQKLKKTTDGPTNDQRQTRPMVKSAVVRKSPETRPQDIARKNDTPVRSSQGSYMNFNTRRCDHCAEPHHIANECRHQRPVKCFSCNSLGHKSKFCESRDNDMY